MDMLMYSVLLFLGTSSWIDFTNPEIRKWWAGKFALSEYQVPKLCGFSLLVVLCRQEGRANTRESWLPRGKVSRV